MEISRVLFIFVSLLAFVVLILMPSLILLSRVFDFVVEQWKPSTHWRMRKETTDRVGCEVWREWWGIKYGKKYFSVPASTPEDVVKRQWGFLDKRAREVASELKEQGIDNKDMVDKFGRMVFGFWLDD